MKHFTKKYVESYSVDGKTKEQLQRDIQICSILLDQFTVTEKRRVLLNRLGAMATRELFRRYGDFALWSTRYINNLPDSAFMWIESGGSKDSEGKTVPRTLRHLPYKNDSGEIDLPHVRNALARLNQVKGMPQSVKDRVELHLKKILDEMKEPKIEYIEFKTFTFEKENYSTTVEVHSVKAEMSIMNPKWLELTGILFHRGIHKGINYEDDVLKSAMLVPREGENLCYVNIYHKKEEGYRVGILADIWWDPDIPWYCPTNDMKGKGALMYRSFITDKQAISEIRDKKIGNVSAELHFNTYMLTRDNEKLESAIHIEVNGKAITPMPALKAADIEKICTIDNKGKRSCQSLQKTMIK